MSDFNRVMTAEELLGFVFEMRQAQLRLSALVRPPTKALVQSCNDLERLVDRQLDRYLKDSANVAREPAPASEESPLERCPKLRALTKEMREAQKEFHDKNRKTASSLPKALRLEKEVDKAIKEDEERERGRTGSLWDQMKL